MSQLCKDLAISRNQLRRVAIDKLAAIPSDLLTHTDKAIITLILKGMTRQSGYRASWFSSPTIQRKTGVSDGAVSRAFRKLKRSGFFTFQTFAPTVAAQYLRDKFGVAADFTGIGRKRTASVSAPVIWEIVETSSLWNGQAAFTAEELAELRERLAMPHPSEAMAKERFTPRTLRQKAT